MTEFLIGLSVAVSGSFLNWVATKIYNAVTGSERSFLWKDKNVVIDNSSNRLGFEELKKKIRIVLIDDEDIFPVELFIKSGYFVEKWNSVTDYDKLESGFYDIIILDIIGVATKIFSTDDGLGVLKSLKNNNPSQIIVAYSGHSFDLSKQKFWDLADEKIAKPSDFLTTKEIIDNLIKSKYNPDRYKNSLISLLKNNNLRAKEIAKIERSINKVINERERSVDWNSIFNALQNNKELLGKSVNLATTILKFFIKD